MEMNNLITLNDYQVLASSTANHKLTATERLLNVALGLSGESGEVADLLKKHLHHDHNLDLEKIKKELGDILWYVSEGARALGIPLNELACANIEKLEKRYPQGFDPERSKNRTSEE